MKVVSYKCPNCMGPMQHDIDSQMWKCDFCGTELSPEEIARIEATEGSEQIEQDYINPPPIDARAENYQGADQAVAYSCPSCGGHIVTAPETAATFCVYCHNPTVIAAHLEGEHRPQQILPFKLKKDEAIEAMKKLCKGKPFLPGDFRRIINKGELGGMYVPFWLFDIDMQAYLSAWGKRITTWSDSTYNYTKTDTYLVERVGDTFFGQIPADSSSRMDDQLMDALEPFDYSQMVPFSMQYLSGHFAESFDVEADKSIRRADQRAQNALQSMLRDTVNGYNSVTVTSFKPNHRHVGHQNVMLPVWTLSLTYKEKIWVYAMNGQSGKLAGKLPKSAARIAAWLGIGSVGLSLLSLGVMALLRMGGVL